MRVTLLPGAAVRQEERQALTSFLVDEALAIDGGSVGIALDPAAVGRIRHAVITHAHMDHVASLPILVSEIYESATSTLPVYALPEVIRVLRAHIFNNEIWPDFERIPLPGRGEPALEFRELPMGRWTNIGEYRVRAVEVNHTVPAAGLFVEREGLTVGFSADTYVTDEFWRVARTAPDLRALFVDVSYPDEMEPLAAVARHLTPRLLEIELTKLGREVETLAVHLKPSLRPRIEEQLRRIVPPVRVAGIGRPYVWEPHRSRSHPPRQD